MTRETVGTVWDLAPFVVLLLWSIPALLKVGRLQGFAWYERVILFLFASSTAGLVVGGPGMCFSDFRPLGFLFVTSGMVLFASLLLGILFMSDRLKKIKV